MTEPTRRPGFFDQFRGLHWSVKIIIVVVGSVVVSPFLALGSFIASQLVGGMGVFLVWAAGFAGACWFVFTSPPSSTPPAAQEHAPAPEPRRQPVGQPTPARPFGATSGVVARYCESCGESFPRSLLHCPSCNTEWNWPVFATPITDIARYLNLIGRDFEDGFIDRASFNRLRNEYDRRLRALRPRPEPEPEPEPVVVPPPAVVPAPAPIPAAARPPVASEPVPVHVAPAEVHPVAAAAVKAPEPVRPVAAIPEGPPGPTIGDMGRAVLGWAAERQADILLYVGAFMLSVAAVIFMAYQGEALSGGIRFAVLTTYAVGFLVFGLWLHRWDRVKEAAPVFLALGAILVPIDFLALRTQVLGEDQVSNEMLWLLGSSSCSVLYFALALRGYGKLYFAPAVPSALVAWGSLGAVLQLPVAWFGPWYLAIAAPGYVWAVAKLETIPLARWIAFGSLVVAVPALALAHLAPAVTGDDQFAAPVGYALVFAAALAGLPWRRDPLALAALPALGATAGGTFAWAAFDSSPEWRVPFVAVAGLGYLVVGHFEPERRARAWGAAAAALGALSLILAHFAAWQPEPADSVPGVLPVTYALAFIGASGAYARWRWIEAAAAMPPAAAMVVLGSAWAARGVGVEWFGAYAGIAPLGYLALAVFDRQDRRVAWRFAIAGTALLGPAITHAALAVDSDAAHWSLAAAYGPALATALVASALWRFTWRPAPGSLPALTSLTALAFVWAQWDIQPEWFTAFAAGASLGYVALAWLEPPVPARFWAPFAFAAAVLAIMGAHVAVLEPEASRWALTVAYAICLTASVGASFRWRFEWNVSVGFVPPLAGMTALTFGWAQWDLAPEWFPPFAAASALGYVALAWFDRPQSREAWLQIAFAFGAVAVSGAHVAVATEEAAHHPLPLTYALSLLGASAVFARWRYQWRAAPALVPPLAAMTALGFAWAQHDLPPEWYPPFAAACGLGFLPIAWFDERSFARNWASLLAVSALGAIAGAHVASLLGDESRWALPVTYFLATAGFGIAYAKWRWAEVAALLPPAVAATALTASWAGYDLQPEWFASYAAATAFGYLALAKFGSLTYRAAWWNLACLGPSLGIAVAHAMLLADAEVQQFALPMVYAVSLAAASAAFATWRFAWRLPPAAAPALAGATVLAFSWARWDLSVWWWGAFAVPAAFGYVAMAIFDQKSRTRAWLAGATLASALGVGVAQLTQLDPEAAHRALPLAYGESLLAAAFVVAWWRLSVREAIVVLPALAAAFGASFGWAEFDMRLEWLTAWAAAAAAGYFVPAYYDARYRTAWRAASIVGSAAALLSAHALAFRLEPVEWQLPVAYASILAVWTWHALALRDETVLGPPLLASVFGASALWAAGVGPEWWAYPALAVAASMAASEQVLRRNQQLERTLWAYALLLGPGATVLTLAVNYTHPAQGLATQAAAAALFFVAAWRSNGTIARLLDSQARPFVLRAERVGLVQAGFAFVFGAAASLNGVLELAGPDRAWALTAVALVPWAMLALPVLRRDALWMFTPLGLAGVTIAAAVAVGDDGILTAVLALGVLGPVAGHFGIRRWVFLGMANSFLMLAIWAAWRWQDVDLAYLPVGFAVLAVAEWAILTRLRRYSPRPGEADLVIAYLSWVPWLIAGGVAGVLLAQKQGELAPADSLVTTTEWALAAAVLAMTAAAVTGEGLRIWKRWLWMAGSAGLLGALLMGIATFEPSNVQAYTAPIGAWIVFAGLTFRTTPELFGRHLLAHEAVMLLGALMLVLPPAEQSFEPAGGKFGLELIGLALAMVIVGLLLHGRWLVAAGVSTLTATAMRMITGGLFSTPYWLLLGLGGTALIGFGLLVLLERERWDRFRRRVVEWWQQTAAKGPPADSETRSQPT